LALVWTFVLRTYRSLSTHLFKLVSQIVPDLCPNFGTFWAFFYQTLLWTLPLICTVYLWTITLLVPYSYELCPLLNPWNPCKLLIS
jgi:hypothetical protein